MWKTWLPERAERGIMRDGRFSDLKKVGKECIDIRIKDPGEGDQLRDFDVHAVGFQFGVGAFGHRDAHQVKLCNHLILGKLILIADCLDVFADIHIRSDFLHDNFLSSYECFAMKKLYVDSTGFTFYNVSQ